MMRTVTEQNTESMCAQVNTLGVNRPLLCMLLFVLKNLITVGEVPVQLGTHFVRARHVLTKAAVCCTRPFTPKLCQSRAILLQDS